MTFIDRFKLWFQCLINGHTWIATEADWDHMAGTGWYRKCTVCGKWKKLR